MTQILSVRVSMSGILYEVDAPGEELTLDLDMDGRRVWSFRSRNTPPPDHLIPAGASPDAMRFEQWPPSVVPFLTGRSRVRLRPSGSDSGAEATVVFGNSTEPVRLVDRHGRMLVVNKWGRLGRALADAPPGMVERMLDHMDQIRILLEKHLGPIVFVTGGTLLGPVRENGRLLPHDDDADLAYLSNYSHPADVAMESFEVGRMLREAGFDVLRLSVGHLQVLFSHQGVPDHYVDVFPGFLMDGFWLQHFAIRIEATRDQILPPSTVLVAGRAEPATRDQELTLQALYGPGWRQPDPSFVFDIPASTGDRFYGWFGDYNVEREDWEDVHLLRPPGVRADTALSAFGEWVHDRAPHDAPLLELGCGAGSDALALSALGRRVHAVDFSRYALAAATEQPGPRDGDVEFELLNLLDTRPVLRLGARLAATEGNWSVFGRRLLNALEDRGRDNVFRLAGMLLRRGGRAYFDVVADREFAGIAPHRHLTVDGLVAEAARRRLVLHEVEPRSELLSWFGSAVEQVVPLHRMTFRWRTS
jgi:SAM-dependent methyltransferase